MEPQDSPSNPRALTKSKSEEELYELRQYLGDLENQVEDLELELKLKIMDRQYRQADAIKHRLEDLRNYFIEKKQFVLRLEHERAVHYC